MMNLRSLRLLIAKVLIADNRQRPSPLTPIVGLDGLVWAIWLLLVNGLVWICGRRDLLDLGVGQFRVGAGLEIVLCGCFAGVGGSESGGGVWVEWGWHFLGGFWRWRSYFVPIWTASLGRRVHDSIYAVDLSLLHLICYLSNQYFISNHSP